MKSEATLMIHVLAKQYLNRLEPSLYTRYIYGQYLFNLKTKTFHPEFYEIMPLDVRKLAHYLNSSTNSNQSFAQAVFKNIDKEF